LFEVSIETAVVLAATARAGFRAFPAEVGAGRDDGLRARTRWALDHAANHDRQA
jgi:hypothetical protein